MAEIRVVFKNQKGLRKNGAFLSFLALLQSKCDALQHRKPGSPEEATTDPVAARETTYEIVERNEALQLFLFRPPLVKKNVITFNSLNTFKKGFPRFRLCVFVCVCFDLCAHALETEK